MAAINNKWIMYPWLGGAIPRRKGGLVNFFESGRFLIGLTEYMRTDTQQIVSCCGVVDYHERLMLFSDRFPTNNHFIFYFIDAGSKRVAIRSSVTQHRRSPKLSEALRLLLLPERKRSPTPIGLRVHGQSKLGRSPFQPSFAPHYLEDKARHYSWGSPGSRVSARGNGTEGSFCFCKKKNILNNCYS